VNTLKRIGKTLERAVKVFLYEVIFRYAFRNKPMRLPVDIRSVKEILLIRRDMLGDMVITTSVIRWLKEKNPDLAIDIICSKRNADVITHNPKLRTVFYGQDFSSSLETIRAARKKKYDVILGISYARTTADGVMANLISHTTPKVGIYEVKSAHLYRYLFNTLIDIGKSKGYPEFPLYQALHIYVTTLFGLPRDEASIRQEIFLSDAERQESEQFIAEKKLGRFVVYNLSASASFRKWGMENNVQCLRTLIASYPDLHFLIVSSPEDHAEARELCEKINHPNVSAKPESFDLMRLCGLISKAFLVISPDTSIVHIAATFGVPCVILCTPISSSLEWTPLGIDHINIYSGKGEAISTIAPMRVTEAFRELHQRIKRLQ
jgi:ADP-heptose:LPS heptosyltransferase